MLNECVVVFAQRDEALVFLGECWHVLFLLLTVFHRHDDAVLLQHLGELQIAREILTHLFFGLAL